LSGILSIDALLWMRAARMGILPSALGPLYRAASFFVSGRARRYRTDGKIALDQRNETNPTRKWRHDREPPVAGDRRNLARSKTIR